MNPVFQNINATTKSITMGNSKITMWAKGSGGWNGGEVACYTGGINKQIQVQVAGQKMVGSFMCPDGTFSWEMYPNPDGGDKIFWQMTARIAEGEASLPQLMQQGLF